VKSTSFSHVFSEFMQQPAEDCAAWHIAPATELTEQTSSRVKSLVSGHSEPSIAQPLPPSRHPSQVPPFSGDMQQPKLIFSCEYPYSGTDIEINPTIRKTAAKIDNRSLIIVSPF
jgi:hypothetical protein